MRVAETVDAVCAVGGHGQGSGRRRLCPATDPPLHPGPAPLQILKHSDSTAISIKDLSEMTMFKTDDIISTLQVPWKGLSGAGQAWGDRQAGSCAGSGARQERSAGRPVHNGAC